MASLTGEPGSLERSWTYIQEMTDLYMELQWRLHRKLACVSILKRPVQKPFPLEVGEASATEKEEPARPVICSPERRRRRAAIEGEARRRQVDQYLDTVEDGDEHWSRGEDV